MNLKTVAAAFAALIASAGSAAAQQGWDMTDQWQIWFQEAASPTMEKIVALNDLLTFIVVGIVVLVFGLLVFVMWRFRASRNPTPATWSHNTPLEIAWTGIPVLLLLVVAIPSFQLLYFMDRVEDADMTIKITGHQWYWSYEYPDHDLAFDALMVADEDLQPGQPRLLTTDTKVVVPVGAKIRLLMTSDDVIHSWAVPALGVKTDSVPGRLNETWMQVTRPGVFYGQCSELCGVNHGFMPIMIEALPPEQWQAWLEQAKVDFARDARPADYVAALNAR